MGDQRVAGPPSMLNIAGNIIRSPLLMATHLNQFYRDKAVKIREAFIRPTSDPALGLKKMLAKRKFQGTFEIQTVSRSQLRKIIRKMKSTKSVGVDGISMRFIKDNIEPLLPALHNIIQQSISHQTFPSSLKTSRVIPLEKSDSPHDQMSSYRPVNIQNSTSKIIERVIFGQLAEYLTQNNLLPGNHHGSRAGHSTTTALLDIYEKLVDNHEKGLATAVLSLDQSAAYEIIDHQLLQLKIQLLGANPAALSWIQSFLADRSQAVEIQTKTSAVIAMPPCSVIQGSLASCLLYAIFTIDLPMAIHDSCEHDTDEDYSCPEGTVTTYVDDSSAVISAVNTRQLKEKAQETSEKLERYLDANLLKVNRDKSKLLINCPARQDRQEVVIQTGDKPIKPSKNLKLNGSYLSQDLLWNHEIGVTMRQLNYRVYILI